MTPLAKERFLSAGLVLVAALGLLAVALTSHSITTSEQRSRPQNLFSVFYEAEIRRITLQPHSADADSARLRTVLERKPSGGSSVGEWALTHPVRERADAAAVKQFLAALRSAEWVRQASAEASRDALGLSAPFATLQVEMESADYQLAFGNLASQPEGARYVEVLGRGVPNAGIYVVRSDFMQDVLLAPDAFRVRRVVPYGVAETKAVVLTGAGGERRFVKRDGVWYFEPQPGGARLDRRAVDLVFLQLSRANAEHFIESSKVEAAFAADNPSVNIELVPTSGEVARLRFGGTCEILPADIAGTGVDNTARAFSGVVAQRISPEPVAACVPSNVMVGMDVSAEQLADHHLSRLNVDEVEQVELVDLTAGEPKRLEFARTETGYILRAPSEGSLTRAVGDARLEDILGISGDLRTKPTGELRLAYELTLTAAGGAQEAARIYLAGDLLWAERKADGRWLELPRSAETALAADATLLRAPEILDLETKSIRQVEISGPIAQRFTLSESGTALLTTPEGYEADPSVTDHIARELAGLRARRWVSDTRLPRFELEAPWMTVFFSVAADADVAPTQHTLRVGARTRGGRYATLDEDPAVFVLSPQTIERLSTWALDTSAFDLRWDAAQSMTFRFGAESLTLQRLGSALQAPSGSEVSAEELQEVSSELLPQLAVHPGSAEPNEGFAQPTLEILAVLESGSVRITFGSQDSFQDVLGYYVRVDRVDATFFIAAGRVRPLLDALR